MGVNLQKKAQKNFNKQTDRAIRDVSDGDLFDKTPESCQRSFLAELCNGARIKKGETLDAELKDNLIIGTRGVEKVLQAKNPPTEVVEYIKSKSGITEIKIFKLNPRSGVVEIDLC